MLARARSTLTQQHWPPSPQYWPEDDSGGLVPPVAFAGTRVDCVRPVARQTANTSRCRINRATEQIEMSDVLPHGIVIISLFPLRPNWTR